MNTTTTNISPTKLGDEINECRRKSEINEDFR